MIYEQSATFSVPGSSDDNVKGHLCVLAVASPLIKNQALNGTLATTSGMITIPVTKYSCKTLNHFVSFAYRGYVSLPAEEVGELYNLADYFMDIALQTAITNTVGSIPANIPNIAEVLTNSEICIRIKTEAKNELQGMCYLKHIYIYIQSSLLLPRSTNLLPAFGDHVFVNQICQDMANFFCRNS